MGKRLKAAEAQAGRLADQVARLNAQIAREQDERIEALDAGLGDLHANPTTYITVITPSGKLLRGRVIKIEEEVDAIEVGVTTSRLMPGRRTTELRIALTP